MYISSIIYFNFLYYQKIENLYILINNIYQDVIKMNRKFSFSFKINKFIGNKQNYSNYKDNEIYRYYKRITPDKYSKQITCNANTIIKPIIKDNKDNKNKIPLTLYTYTALLLAYGFYNNFDFYNNKNQYNKNNNYKNQYNYNKNNNNKNQCKNSKNSDYYEKHIISDYKYNNNKNQYNYSKNNNYYEKQVINDYKKIIDIHIYNNLSFEFVKDQICKNPDIIKFIMYPTKDIVNYIICNKLEYIDYLLNKHNLLNKCLTEHDKIKLLEQDYTVSHKNDINDIIVNYIVHQKNDITMFNRIKLLEFYGKNMTNYTYYKSILKFY